MKTIAWRGPGGENLAQAASLLSHRKKCRKNNALRIAVQQLMHIICLKASQYFFINENFFGVREVKLSI